MKRVKGCRFFATPSVTSADRLSIADGIFVREGVSGAWGDVPYAAGFRGRDSAFGLGAEVDRAGILIAGGLAGDAVPTCGDLVVGPSPQGGGAGEVQDRHRPPERRQSAAEVTDRVAAAVHRPVGPDDEHLRHQRFVGERRVPLGDAGVVQRQETEPFSPPIEPPEVADLALAEAALAVKNHHVAPWRFVGIGELFHGESRGEEIGFEPIECSRIVYNLGGEVSRIEKSAVPLVV